MLRARACAKINLYLAVLGRLPDGYHDIETVFQSVDLYDELGFERAEDIEVSCSIPELCGQGNLAHVAAEQLRAAAGVTFGARIHIEKQIPVAAGLAGGSADAAAALVGLNGLWRLGLSADALAGIAARIGADVPFCLVGGTAFGTGSGTKLSKVTPLHDRLVVLGKPVGSLLASDVYAAFDEDPTEPHRSSTALRAYLDVEQEGDIGPLMENALEPAVIGLMPPVRRVRDAALSAGANCALVSGSGPSVFAIADSQARADAVAGALRPICEFVGIHRPVTHGVELFEE